MTQPTPLRCNRGHYLPRNFRPHGDPDTWDDTCRCGQKPKPAKPAT